MDANTREKWDNMAALEASQHRRDHPAYRFSPQHTNKEKRKKAQDVKLPQGRKKGPKAKKQGGAFARPSAVAMSSPTEVNLMASTADTVERVATPPHLPSAPRHTGQQTYISDALCLSGQYIQEMQSQLPTSVEASESLDRNVPQWAAPQPILQHLNPLPQSIQMVGFTNNVIAPPDAENPPLDEFQTPPYTASSAESSYGVSPGYTPNWMSSAIPGQQHFIEPGSERLHWLATMQGSDVPHRWCSDEFNSLETQYRNGIPYGSMPLDEGWPLQMPS
ncbi:predicted protein [Postia placenta Mad-698-R]|nr:predicted protein [Postia placenta Mad-698-R]